MNIQWGDKGIGWTDATWNPVTGCKNNCSYCYARKISHRFGRSFEPTFHPERLEEPYKLKKPAKIFVCSMGELFGPWAPREWQEAVIKVAKENPRHTFQFLTKFPGRSYPDDVHRGYNILEEWPDNAWLGVTITGRQDWQYHFDLMFLGPEAKVKFISIEPFLYDLNWPTSKRRLVAWLFGGTDWLILGAQTNPNLQPERRYVDELVAQADLSGVPVFMKSNLDYEPKRREFPHDS